MFRKITLLLILILLFTSTSLSQEQTQEIPVTIEGIESSPPARYRIQGHHEFYWTWTNELPYVATEYMCWDETIGFNCDERLQTLTVRETDEYGNVFYEEHPENNPVLRNIVFDRETNYTALVYENRHGCWLWWFREFSLLINPHPVLAVWIDCETVWYPNE